MTPDTTPGQIRSALAGHLSPAGEQWLAEAETKIASDATAVRALFPAAGRRCGRAPLPALPGWHVDDAVRALLLGALAEPSAELAGLYRYGDTAEKRGVLRALAAFDAATVPPAEGLPLVHDALRTNDTRLVTAALGPYAAAHLDAAAYRQGVLKCVFMGVPLAEISGLRERADAELARMFADYAAERRAAGRSVPDDIWLVLERDRPDARS